MRTDDPTVHKLSELWTSLSGGKDVRSDVSFIDQGADSLLLITLLSEIESEFDAYIEAEELLENPTIESLARVIERKLEPSDARLVDRRPHTVDPRASP